MKAKTYFLETFGCQMNVLDSQLIAAQLRELGFAPVSSAREADVVLFNTCSVRQHAEDKVLSRLGHLKRLKRRRPEVVIGVLGCMAERMKQDLLADVPHLDLICGPGELHQLPGLLERVARERGQISALAAPRATLRRTPEPDDPLEKLDLSRSAAAGENALQSYVRVQRGCDKFCTYCVVPFVRGPERSRPAGNIVTECRQLVGHGCREITLLGQTVNSYSYDEDGRSVGLARLLERVHAIEGLDRVRFVTSYPADWDEDIFRAMRDCPKVCPYLHIPAQSGSDRMLKAMRRGYTSGEYLRLMDTARRYVPDIALAGDFIVGFCGETEADFVASVDLVQRVEYKSIFVFKYSPRPGTSAGRVRQDDVPPEVKAARNNELLAVQSEIGLRQKRQLVGQTVEVLVEGYSKPARRARLAANGGSERTADGRPADSGETLRETRLPPPKESGIHAGPDQLIGRTPHDLIVVFDGAEEHIGGLVNVRVGSVSPLTVFGRLESVASRARSAR